MPFDGSGASCTARARACSAIKLRSSAVRAARGVLRSEFVRWFARYFADVRPARRVRRFNVVLVLAAGRQMQLRADG
jgi:hypothetical protein